MNYLIHFPTSFNEVDENDDNIDVCLQFEDNRRYTLVIATPENLKSLMKKDGVPFIRPGLPFLIVEKLTQENVYKVVESLLIEDDLLLQTYGGDL